MEDNSIAYAQHLRILEQEMLRPSVLYQQAIKISIDGNAYCVLLGLNLQEGVAGFGKTLKEAINDFDTNFEKK